MSESIENKILTKLKREKKGTIFFTEDFVSIGNAKTVSKALERLTNRGDIERVARGVYQKIEYSTFLGQNIAASTDDIAKAIAKRDKARIIKSGVFALNALGLSTQVPMNVVYLTDGASRRIKIGNINGILFKKTSPKNLATKSHLCSLAIQAIKAIGKDKIYESEKKKLIDLLKKEDIEILKHDIALAPEWVRIIMREALIR